MSSILVSERAGGGSVRSEERAARAALARAEALVDAKLVKQFTGGDETAFDEIVRRHRCRVFHVVSACLHNRSDAEEIVDDTFIRAYRGLAGFRGDSSLATWLHHIAINLSRNRYWHLFRRRLLEPGLDAPVSADSRTTYADFVPSDTLDPLQELDQGEFNAIVVACLDHLPPGQREILKLRALLNGSYADIAAELGISVGTVKSRIARARRRLRRAVTSIAPESAIRSTQSF